MASVIDTMGNKYIAAEGLELLKITYDFAVDGGSVASLTLFTPKQDMVIHKAIMKVKTACTSGGSATVSVGAVGSVAAYVAATAVASLTANAIITGVATRGPSGIRAVADTAVVLDIATAALTAGKIEVELIVSKF